MKKIHTTNSLTISCTCMERMYETMPVTPLWKWQTTELSHCHTFILWNCRTIELSYYQTVIPKSAPITAMADFPFVRHCWLHLTILYTNPQCRSYSSIILLFDNPTRLVHIKKYWIKTGLCYLNYSSWRVCFPKCPQSNWKKNCSNLMNIIFMLHKTLYAYRAVGLLSCRTSELSVDMMVHRSEEIR